MEVSASAGNVPASTSARYAATAPDLPAQVRVLARVRGACVKPVSPAISVTTWISPAAPGARADADGGDREPLRDGAASSGHELQHDREGPGLLDREGVGEEPAGLFAVLALDADRPAG